MTGRNPRDLLQRPLVVAPMGGGPSTPDLVFAASRAGALGFLAGGYKTTETMLDEVDRVREASKEPFGVNLFVPGSPTSDRTALAAYLESLQGEASRLGCELGEPAWDDDGWTEKVAALVASPPPVVSFTFGCPDQEIVAALHDAGSQVWVTVTAPLEAGTAAARNVDALCVQGPEAGAHRGTFSDGPVREHEPALFDLVREVARVTDLPLVAAGGVMDAAGMKDALAAGAIAAQCGTAFLCCPESGAHALHKGALTDPRFTETRVTRAFSGRPARGLVNRFLLGHLDAPAAYPEINNATRPLRAAAAARGEAQSMSLWAGAGWRAASNRSAGEVVELICGSASRGLGLGVR